MTKIVLVIAAHADDEVLGCGGTISRHVGEGDIVYTVIMADGVSSRKENDRKEILDRTAAAERAREILGVKKNYYLEFPDNKMDSICMLEIIQRLESIVEEIRPNIIYTHHRGDLNVDHVVTHQAVLTACRPIPGSCVEAIYAFEIMSSTEWAAPQVSPFLPNHYVDITNYLMKKRSALQEYNIEMREQPHSRSIQNLMALAHFRGNTMGVNSAEAFITIRTIKK